MARREQVKDYPRLRTLHLVDLNNLLGRPDGEGWRGWALAATVRAVLDAYLVVARIHPGDHQVIVATPLVGVEAKLVTPSCRLVLRRGSLIQLVPTDLHPDWCAAHYDRVVLGSGDASVAAMSGALSDRRVSVTVVMRSGCSSRALANTDGVVMALWDKGRKRELA